MTTLTKFGKLLRKIRIDNNQVLEDMAILLNVSSSYLSAVETGKRNVPSKWLNIICDSYHLSNDMETTLEIAAFESQKNIKIDLEHLDNDKRQIILLLIKNISILTSEQKQSLFEILK